MTDYFVAVIAPDGYDHSGTFADVAYALQSSLHDAGHRATASAIRATGQPCVDRWIVLGANLLPHHPAIQVPDDAILMNLELPGSYWFTPAYLDLLRQHEVWDYSPDNIRWLAEQGVTAKLCRIGYHPCLSRIEPEPESIDVLFYGSNTERRIRIIRALCDEGISVQCLFGCYGKARDDWIAKAKLILNLHSWDQPAPLEIVRLQLLFANRKCVVTEPGMPGELEWETYRGCVAEIDPSRPKDAAFAIKYLLADYETRMRIARMGFDAFSQHPQKDYLPL